MSFPVTEFTCSKCSFTGDNTVSWGKFAYELADGKLLPLERSIGWCYECDRLAGVETLDPRSPQDVIFGEPMPDSAERRAELKKVKARLLTRLGFGKAKIKNMTDCLESTLKFEENVALYNKNIVSRSEPSKCLRCSSANVIILRYPHPIECAPPLPTGFIHPNCGGSILVAMSGDRLAMMFDRVRVYECSGRFLRDQPAPKGW